MATEKNKSGIYQEETYKITLPLTEEKQDDVPVIINGEITQIQRGVEVEVSAAVYEVLKNQEKMDALAFQRRKNLAERGATLR